MIVYPDPNYVSWISVEEAEAYFETRLRADEWATGQEETALQTAFRSLKGLDLALYLNEQGLLSDAFYTAAQKEEILNALKEAQCEQALHELKFDVDGQAVKSVSLGGMLSFTLNPGEEKAPRYSERALMILRPWLRGRTVQRVR